MRHLDRREWLKLALKGSFGLATLSSLQLGLLPQALAAGRAAPDGSPIQRVLARKLLPGLQVHLAVFLG